MGKTIRWGIVGLGNIAAKFAKDLALVKAGVLTAVASRSGEKAREFSKEFNAEYAFDSYEDLFLCDAVDVVYIALPHTEHRHWSILAMQRGKHVLCEKPMGVNTEEVAAMIQASKDHKVFLMEALWTRFNPAIRKAKDMADTGELGTLSYLHADFSFYGLDRDPEGRILNPALAGGSLLDIGIYPVFLAYIMLGLPEGITSFAKFHKTGAEVQISVLFDYPNAHALLHSGLAGNSVMAATIAGSEGTVIVHPRWHETQGLTLIKDDQEEKLEFTKLGKGYTYEIEEVHQCLREHKLESALWSHQNSMELIGLLDRIREQMGIRFPFEE